MNALLGVTCEKSADIYKKETFVRRAHSVIDAVYSYIKHSRQWLRLCWKEMGEGDRYVPNCSNKSMCTPWVSDRLESEFHFGSFGYILYTAHAILSTFCIPVVAKHHITSKIFLLSKLGHHFEYFDRGKNRHVLIKLAAFSHFKLTLITNKKSGQHIIITKCCFLTVLFIASTR